MVSKKAIILFGAPGSGKGTQGILLEKKTKFKRYGMSDLIRRDIKSKNNKNGFDFSSGLLLNDSDIFGIFKKYFKFEKKVIFDGFPRTEDQAYWLCGYLLPKGYEVSMIHYKTKEKNLVKRILLRAKKEGRKDDTVEVFKRRMKIFNVDKKKILKIFNNRIIEVNGESSVEEVFDESLKKLKKEKLI